MSSTPVTLAPGKAMTVFPPITPTAQAKTQTPSTSSSSTQLFDPTQSLSSLLASLSLPSLTVPASSSTSSSSPSPLTSSTPSLFSCYLLSILHSTLSDLSTVLSISPRSLDDPSLTSNPALLIALKDHLQLEHHHTLLTTALAQLTADDEGYPHQLALVQQQFHLIIDSTRALIRLLPHPPHAAAPASPSASSTTTSASTSAFHSLFSHLVALITNRLQLSAKDASKQQTLLASLTSQHSTDTALLATLTNQLHSQRQRQALTLTQQSALLSKYQTALSSLLDTAEEDVLNFNRRMKVEEEENERLYEAKEAELVEEERRLSAEWEAGLREEWRVEAALRRKVGLKDGEVQAVVDRYDEEMQWQEDVYAQLSSVYEREREEARRLAVYFDRVREREEGEAEERERLKARRDEELVDARERDEGVRVLTALFDHWMKKNGPKEKKKAGGDKKKKYKPMWRPPREEGGGDAAAAEEAAQAVPAGIGEGAT